MTFCFLAHKLLYYHLGKGGSFNRDGGGGLLKSEVPEGGELLQTVRGLKESRDLIRLLQFIFNMNLVYTQHFEMQNTVYILDSY